MSDDQQLSAALAELFEVVDEAIAFVLEDRADALAEGRDPLTLWDLIGHVPRAMAIAEMRLEHTIARLGTRGEA